MPPLPLLPSPSPAFQSRGADRPRQVPLPAARDAAYAVLRDGTVRVWGDIRLSNSPKEGFTNSPVPVAGVANVALIVAVGNNTFVVKADGSLWGWGGGGSSDWPFKTNVKVPTAVELR